MPDRSLTYYRQQIDKNLADYRHAAMAIVDEEEALDTAKQNYAASIEAQKIVQEAAVQIQNQVHAQLSAVVSKSLATVFKNPYEFKIKFEQKRGKTEALLTFQRGELELENPAYEAGVGQVDIAALALRLACLMLMRPRKRLLLVADEPFKNVNGNGNRIRTVELLVSLSENLGCQIVMSTGYEWLQIGKVVEMGE